MSIARLLLGLMQRNVGKFPGCCLIEVRESAIEKEKRNKVRCAKYNDFSLSLKLESDHNHVHK